MSTTVGKYIDTVSWDRLQHAYGPAGDLPPFLEAVASASSGKLNQAIGELCARVLHQGTIYSASPPAVHVLIEMLSSAESKRKQYLYPLLDAFADSARMAIEDGPAPPSCAGGDPADGEAIRKELADARSIFDPDLTHSDAEIRVYVASLLGFIAGQDASAADLLRRAYPAETDSQVRHAMLAGLARSPNAYQDATDFWNGALQRETEPGNRFVVRMLEIRALKAASDATSVEDLASSFVKACDSQKHVGPDDHRFFEAIALLGTERELAALLQAFEVAREGDVNRILAEHLLRLVFDDQRTGWGRTASSRLKDDGSPPPQPDLYRASLRMIGLLMLFKLLPFARRWHVRRLTRRKPTGIRKIEYWGLKGVAPEIPECLNDAQRAALTAFARKSELWNFRTNLFALFGLPDSAAGLLRFLEER